MRLFWKKFHRDQGGLSLVELICTIAIFSSAVAIVGGAMVASANNYQRGNVELNLQQESQTAANIISNLIVDSTVVEYSYYDGSGWVSSYVSGDANVPILSDADVPSGAGAQRRLAIAGAEGNYWIEYDATNSQLLFTHEDAAGNVIGANQLLAENVQSFAADISQYDAAKSVKIDLTIADNSRDNLRTFATSYNMTSRNGVGTGSVEFATSAVINVENEVILEPGQSYSITAILSSTGLSSHNLVWTAAGGNVGAAPVSLGGTSAGSTVSVSGNTATVQVGLDEMREQLVFYVSTAETAADGNALDNVPIYVRVRRVNSLDQSDDKIDGGDLVAGVHMKDGAQYRLYATVAGTNLERRFGVAYDMDYVSPYSVTWSYEVHGTDGGLVSNPDEWVSFSGVSGLERPYATLSLHKDIEDGMNIIVRATALHPEGSNKTGLDYNGSDTIIAEWSLATGFQISVSGFARGGYSDVLLENVLDEWINWNYETDYSSWDYENDAPVRRKLDTNNNYIDLKFYIFKSWATEHEFDVWIEGGHNNMAAWPESEGQSERYFDTNVGFKTTVVPYDSLDLKEYLSYDFYSYSTPYYIGMFDTGISQMKFEVTLYEGYDASGPSHVASVIFDVPEVVFQFRNSSPSDGEGAWSPKDGGLVVYVTPDDHMANDTYTSYFQLLDGWSSTNTDYVAYNRFVGVIKDEAGYENDVRYDLSFVDSAGVAWSRPLPSSQWDIYGDQYYEGWQILQNNGNPNRQVISSGSNGNCTVSVKIPKDERDNLCAGDGTIIKEIYEYNYLFGTEALKQWYGNTDYPVWDMYNSVDGCDGYLEYHFVQANIDASVAGPSVRYCPRPGDKGLINDIYYISTNERFVVSSDGSTAVYEIGGANNWTPAANMTWDISSSMWK